MFLVRNGCVQGRKIKGLDACDMVEIWRLNSFGHRLQRRLVEPKYARYKLLRIVIFSINLPRSSLPPLQCNRLPHHSRCSWWICHVRIPFLCQTMCWCLRIPEKSTTSNRIKVTVKVIN